MTLSTPPAVSSPTVGALLKRYRRAAGLTQEQLAERAGYSVGHISKLESSVRHPVSATIDLLADALALSDTEQAVLRRAAKSQATSVQPRSGRPARAAPRLVDRAPAIERIERHLSDLAPPLLLLTGETGIGKSRLLVEAAERGASAGWYVLEGTCRRSDNSPYDPLLTALADVVRGLDPDQLRSALRECSWLVRLLPELAERGVVPMPAWALPADQERRLMFDAVERFLEHLAGPAGTLLVLDNLQWARPDAIDLLSALTHRGARSSLRIIAGCRPSALQPQAPLGTLIADLVSGGLVALESVGPLAPDAAAKLLGTLLAEVGPMNEEFRKEFRAEALRISGGVPFALVSYAHWMREVSARVPGKTARLSIPWDLAQMVRQRVATLPEAALTVVRIAAVVDGDASPALLTTVAQRLGCDEPDALRGLDAACGAGLLVAQGDQGDQGYAFAHTFTQEVVVQDLGTAQHAQLHHEVAEFLAHQGRGTQAEGLATHFIEAGEPHEARVYLERAGTRANALHAYAAAEQFYRALADERDRDALDWEAAQAHERLGAVLAQQGRYAEALAEFERAIQAHRAAGNQDGVGRALALVGWAYLLRGDVEQGIERLERAADTRDLSDRGRTLLYLALGRLHDVAAHYEQALASAEQAVAFARLSRDTQLLARAEMERSTALEMAGWLDESLQVLEHTAIPLNGAIGDIWTQALALDRAAQSHIIRGEFDQTTDCIARGLALAHQVEDAYLVAALTHTRGILHYHRGAWRRARTDLHQASLILRASNMPHRAARAAAWLGRIELACGMGDQAVEDLHQGIALAERTGDAYALVVAQCALAEQALVNGSAEVARTLLVPLLSRSQYHEVDLTEALVLLGWSDVELGDAQQGMTWITSSVGWASAQGLRCILVDALRIRALLAERENQWDDALVGFTEALDLARMLPFPYAEAKVRSVYGGLLQRHGDRAQADEQYAAARRLYAQLGEHLYGTQLERSSADRAVTPI